MGTNGDGSVPARGILVAPLKAHPDRIILGYRTFFLRDGLRDGATCNYLLGTPLEVAYTEPDGRRDVDSITPVQHGR
jgi:hypothetical protein